MSLHLVMSDTAYFTDGKSDWSIYFYHIHWDSNTGTFQVASKIIPDNRDERETPFFVEFTVEFQFVLSMVWDVRDETPDVMGEVQVSFVGFGGIRITEPNVARNTIKTDHDKFILNAALNHLSRSTKQRRLESFLSKTIHRYANVVVG